MELKQQIALNWCRRIALYRGGGVLRFPVSWGVIQAAVGSSGGRGGLSLEAVWVSPERDVDNVSSFLEDGLRATIT